MIWKGDALIDGVPDTLDMLRALVLYYSFKFLLRLIAVGLIDLVSETVLVTASWLTLFVQGKKLVFVTNNSTKSRKQYANKFRSLGISVSEVCSADKF